MEAIARLFFPPRQHGSLSSQSIRLMEWTPWLIAIAFFFLWSTYLVLGAQILITILFALSLDLILGYAGIVSLGHAMFFGIGAYTAGLLAVHGLGEPVTGLLIAALAGGLAAGASGLLVLRTHGFSLVIITLLFVAVMHEAANKASFITGGDDGLQGVEMSPILGLFDFDLSGRTAYIYCCVVLFACWYIVRRIVHSPFGLSLVGIRENRTRMNAIGAPVFRRCLTAYAISGALAAIAGALLAQTTEFVSLDTINVERSGIILTVLILGGVGRIYGAFVGGALYMFFQDRMAMIDPHYWYFWMGLMIIFVVMFARGGVLGLVDDLVARMKRK